MSLEFERKTILEKYQEKKLKEVIGLLCKQVLKEKKLKLQERSGPKSSSTVPHKNTGINFLEKVLKKVVPVVEEGYKSLTTSETQRRSYRLHILNAVKNLLLPEETNFNEDPGTSLQEEVKIDVSGKRKMGYIPKNYEDPRLLKVDDRFNPKEPSKEELQKQELEKNTIPGTDETGRNLALEDFKQISTAILSTYEVLTNPEDKDVFFEYLITNLKLYFDRFEDELGSNQITEPDTQSYQQAKGTV